MNGDHVKASLEKSLLSSCSFPAALPKPRPHPAGSQQLPKELPELPGVNKHCRYLFMLEPPGAAGAAGQGLEGHGGWRRHAVPGADTALRAERGRTGPSPAPTLAGSQLAGFRVSPSPLLLPSAAALTSGQSVTSSSSSCPHSPPAAAVGLL